MNYLVNLQIGVDADNPSQALDFASTGKGQVIAVNGITPRPVPTLPATLTPAALARVAAATAAPILK